MTGMLVEPMAQLATGEDLAGSLRQLFIELTSFDTGSPLMLVNAEALSLALRDAELGAWVSRELDAFRTGLAELLRRAAARGETRPDLDPQGAAVMVAALLDGILFHKAVDPSLDLKAAATTLATMLGGRSATQPTTKRRTDRS